MIELIKTCKFCSKEFLAKRKDKVFCSRHCKELYRQEKEYILFKKTYCEECGFIAKDPCQLDVDHLDGNHKNNDPKNLKTLCSNCHRLKTKVSRVAKNAVC